MDEQFHPTLHWAGDYLSVLGLKLIRVDKRGRWSSLEALKATSPVTIRAIDLTIFPFLWTHTMMITPSAWQPFRLGLSKDRYIRKLPIARGRSVRTEGMRWNRMLWLPPLSNWYQNLLHWYVAVRYVMVCIVLLECCEMRCVAYSRHSCFPVIAHNDTQWRHFTITAKTLWWRHKDIIFGLKGHCSDIMFMNHDNVATVVIQSWTKGLIW